MLDLKFIINNIDEIINKLKTRNNEKDFNNIKKLPILNIKKKELNLKIENLRYKQNQLTKEIANNTNEFKKSIIQQSSDLKIKIQYLETQIKKINDTIFEILSNIPNIPDNSVIKNFPNKKYNNSVAQTNNNFIKKFNFKIKDHVELGENLQILDFKRAAKITGSRFVVYKGLGARLERSLIQFMMDFHAQKGYTEIIPPFIVNEKCMFSSGQFPKFKSDIYKIDNNNWYLNPTAEVPAINLHQNEILNVNELPLKYVVFTTCFRKEAGSAGKDTRGIIRQHQFNKVELIKFTKPENSYIELDKMLEDVKDLLEILKIPYRIILLPPNDLGFSATKTYDIEVWLPGSNDYREIASISNTESFQSIRANIKFKFNINNKIQKSYTHTLNGSGLAVGRTIIAILENYQNPDGSVNIPEVLIPYMKTNIIK